MLNNVDNGSICCSMKFLRRVGINFRFETSCFLSHAKDAPIGWWVESIKLLHGTRPIRVFQGETVIAKSVSYHYISGCPLFNAVRVFQQ